MKTTLQGKVALVTGAAGGMGLAIARELTAQGATVIGGDIRTSDEFTELSKVADARMVVADLASSSGAATLVESLGTQRLDILINNVGGMGFGPHAGFRSVEDHMWQLVWDLNFMSAVRLTRAAMPALLAGDGGAVVNMASINARLPGPGIVDYSAVKAALVSLTKTLALEFGPSGVRVNSVSPGPVRTGLWLDEGGLGDRLAAAMGTDRESAMDLMVESLGGIPLGRFGRPEEIADLVVFLAGPSASYINGSDFVIDGGLVKGL